MNRIISDGEAIELFEMYMTLSGVPELEPEEWGLPELRDKRLGIANGSSWISFWSLFFGRKYLPGCKIINVGNDAMQYNFMAAHRDKLECPPISNRETLARYARDLQELFPVDCILSTCSTMNRSYPWLLEGLSEYNIPLVQIDMPMMERAVSIGGRILVVATHGPTIESTSLLLRETAQAMGKEVSFVGANVLEAFELLGQGDIKGHNHVVEKAIREAQKREKIDVVVLAQLSMAVFKLTYPGDEFGVPVLTSAQCGFERVREILLERGSNKK